MNILVCIKQVPRDEDMRLDPETKTLIRSQGVGTISERDSYALEMALRIKETRGGRVTAVTMGPPQAANVLRLALSMGVDDVYLISDRAMGGADAFATASVLAAAKEYLEKTTGDSFDLVLCGAQASDSDTSLVLPELAERLSLPQATFVFDYQLEEAAICVLREADNGHDVLRLRLPAALSVSKTVFPARYPNIRLKLAANRREIPVLNAATIGIAAEDAGVPGSKTAVGSSYFPVAASKDTIYIKEADGVSAAEKLMELLKSSNRI